MRGPLAATLCRPYCARQPGTNIRGTGQRLEDCSVGPAISRRISGGRGTFAAERVAKKVAAERWRNLDILRSKTLCLQSPAGEVGGKKVAPAHQPQRAFWPVSDWKFVTRVELSPTREDD